MSDDKTLELVRYDSRALSQMNQSAFDSGASFGSQSMPLYLRKPYLCYEAKIAELLGPGKCVLELGSGSGTHTYALLQTGAKVVASDISPNSLRLLSKRFSNCINLETVVADMESLPFDVNSFDAVTIAGSLSYGDPQIVDSEIIRVLRPGGTLICVDSLNHNPIYRINRWIHFLRGKRSKSTLKRMPNLRRIQKLQSKFADCQVKYFGALTFAMPIVERLLGDNNAKVLSDKFDSFIAVRRSAFKFVLVAEGLF